jgi:hypothetical protein
VPWQLAHPCDERLDFTVRRWREHGAPAVADEQTVRRGAPSHLLVEELEDLGRIHGRRL